MHHVHHNTVFDLILCAGDEFLRETFVCVWISGSGSCAGQRMAPERSALDLQQQFGGCTNETIDAIPVAGSKAGTKAQEYRMNIYGIGGCDLNVSRNHGFTDVASADCISRCGDCAQVRIDLHSWFHCEAIGGGRRWRHDDC
jgi:hypothetical protein